MKEFARVSLCLGSIVLAGIVMNLLIDTTAKANNPDNPMNVIVTNAPLPVTGSFSVTNTPNVNVTNTPTVTIGNSNVPVSGLIGLIYPPWPKSNTKYPRCTLEESVTSGVPTRRDIMDLKRPGFMEIG